MHGDTLSGLRMRWRFRDTYPRRSRSGGVVGRGVMSQQRRAGSRPERCASPDCTSVLETERAGNPHGGMSSIDSELRDDRRDVVMLFLRAESPNFIHDCGQQSLAR